LLGGVEEAVEIAQVRSRLVEFPAPRSERGFSNSRARSWATGPGATQAVSMRNARPPE